MGSTVKSVFLLTCLIHQNLFIWLKALHQPLHQPSDVLVSKFSFSFGFLPILLLDFGSYKFGIPKVLFPIFSFGNFQFKIPARKIHYIASYKFLEKLCISVGVKCNYHHF